MKKAKKFSSVLKSTPPNAATTSASNNVNNAEGSDSTSSPEDNRLFIHSTVTQIATAAVSSPKATPTGNGSSSNTANNNPAEDSYLDGGNTTTTLPREALDDSDFDLYNIEIPHEVIPANDIEDMVRIATNGKVSEKNRLVSNLTEFVFTYTIENLPSHQSRAPLDQIWYEAGLKFDEIFLNLPNEEIWQDRLFKYFPNQSWPKEFIDYISELKSKKPSQTWLNKTPRCLERTSEEQNITYFGNLLRDRYLTVRNFIKWHLSKKWKDPEELPPGWTLNKLLYAIRKSLWPAECRRRFIETISRKARRQKLSEDETRTLTETPRETKRWDPNWYPSQWLTFLFLNPGPSKHVDYMFTSSGAGVGSGHPSAFLSNYGAYVDGEDDDSSDEEGKGGKKDGAPLTGRKRNAGLIAKAAAAVALTSPGGSVLTPVDEQKRRDCEVSIRALERKLAILTRQGRPDQELRQVENELLECLSIQANAYKKYRPNEN